ncbi:MAG: glycosyltransferase, partial [Candidatus Methanomethylicaceae archaeon]
MKSLRVLHVIPSVGPLRGGPSEFVTLLCKTLAEMGVDVTIATTDDNGPRRLDVQTGRFFERDGYDVIYFPRQTKNYTVSVPLARWLRGNVSRYDCFHIHAVFSFAPTVAAFLARKNSIPYFLHPHGILEDWGMREGRKLAKRLSIALNEKKMLRGAECVFFTSGKEKEESIGKIKDVNYQIVP